MSYLDLETRDGIAIIWLDQEGETHNTLSPAALREFEDVLGRIEHDRAVRAAVFISRKEHSFVTGADLRVLRDARESTVAEELSRQGHRLLRRVVKLPFPTVAAIHGPALGGGLEVALACSYRIASDHPDTRLGLPEVKLGLLPAGGGTQLLPRLIGLQRALGLLLTGKNVYARPARRLGLVDALIHRPGLLHGALTAASELAAGTLKPTHAGPDALSEKLLESNGLSRRIVYRQAERRVQKETRGNYPAPPLILDCVRIGLEEGLDAGLEAEATGFGTLAVSPQARELIGLFFAAKEVEKNPWKEAARPVRRIGVLGAGLMGSGIAEVSAEKGIDVLVKDRDLPLAAGARKKLWDSTRRDVRKGIIRPFDRDVMLERVVPVEHYDLLAGVDLVIEAAPEDAALKRRLIADVEAVTGPGTVIASNTSSIPIAELATESARPESLLGMHYFSPVQKMPLLEIVRTAHTSDVALGTAYETGLRQGKTVIVVNDGPGFYTTRILAAYLNEAIFLLEEGAAVEPVDRAMRDFGFPMGPYALFDLVGLDVSAKITEVLGPFFAARGLTSSRTLERITSSGLLGQKSRRGFYIYRSERSTPSGVNGDIYGFAGGPTRSDFGMQLIQERLALMMVNEAVLCLQEGILDSARDGDLGAVLGLGFPPFLGGPFAYVDAQGSGAIADRLERLQEHHGARFTPGAMLRERAANGTPFRAR